MSAFTETASLELDRIRAVYAAGESNFESTMQQIRELHERTCSAIAGHITAICNAKKAAPAPLPDEFTVSLEILRLAMDIQIEINEDFFNTIITDAFRKEGMI